MKEFLKILQKSEAHLGRRQISEIEIWWDGNYFAKVVHGSQLLIIFPKSPILDVWLVWNTPLNRIFLLACFYCSYSHSSKLSFCRRSAKKFDWFFACWIPAKWLGSLMLHIPSIPHKKWSFPSSRISHCLLMIST